MNPIFAPIAALYALVARVRNLLYDHHLLRAHEACVPTICVGNLAVGGTGKTPFVEWLVEHLQKRYKIAVLSRGYKRKTVGFYLASSRSTVHDLGDECMQIHSKYPALPLAVDENRLRGVERLKLAHPDLQIVILDDAMQHRKILPNLTILLTCADNLYANDHFMPWGRLRDNCYRSRNVDAVVVTKCPADMTPIEKRVVIHDLNPMPFQTLAFSSIVYEPFSQRVAQLPASSGALLVTGIARPKYVEDYVKTHFSNTDAMTFSDHHGFTPSDIQRIEKRALHADVVFTTEKDWMRLQQCRLSPNLTQKIEVLRIHLDIDNTAALEAKIVSFFDQCISSNS